MISSKQILYELFYPLIQVQDGWIGVRNGWKNEWMDGRMD